MARENSFKKFIKQVLLRGKSKEDQERLKNAEFIWDRTGKMSKKEIETEIQKLRKKKNIE